MKEAFVIYDKIRKMYVVNKDGSYTLTPWLFEASMWETQDRATHALRSIVNQLDDFHCPFHCPEIFKVTCAHEAL